jgi:hypothetical protein
MTPLISPFWRRLNVGSVLTYIQYAPGLASVLA